MRTLRWRLTLWYGGMTVTILVVLALVSYLAVRGSILTVREDDVRDTASSASEILDKTGSPESAVGGKIEPKDLPKVSKVGEIRRQDVQVAIRDADGNVVASTPDGEDPPGTDPSEAAYPEVERNGLNIATTFGSSKLPEVTGEAWTVLPETEPVLQRLFATEGGGIAVAVMLMVGLGPLLATRALRPLKYVSTVAGELRQGKLGSRVNLPELKKRRDEVGEVATSFDAMAESLERLFAAERESKETLRRFVADASHELRTPLTSVLGYLDVLDETGDKDPVVRQRALKAMREEGGRMARLVEDLLVLARLDARRAFPLEAVDLVALAREVIADNHLVRRIEFVAPDPAVVVLGEREALRRVISNLLSNAVKHTPVESNVLVSVDVEGREAVLRVADEGTGIPKDALPHVFERFYQAESSRTGEGSGLGLAIVRETVETLQGRVEVEGVSDKGSTFAVYLPLPKESPPQEKPSGEN